MAAKRKKGGGVRRGGVVRGPAAKGTGKAKSGKPKGAKPGRKKTSGKKTAGGKRGSRAPRGKRPPIAASKPAEQGSLWAQALDRAETERSSDSGLIRLNAYLARCGVASRRKSDELINEGRVEVNGETVTEVGTKIDPLRDRIAVDDDVLKPERPVYVLLHKPKGVVCTNARNEQKPRAIDLLHTVRERVFSVGRLDLDSEGLLIFTNDGAFAERLTHPRYGVPKTYDIVLRGRIEGEQIEKARGGVWLAEGRTRRARVRVKRRGAERSYLEVSIREGRNRELRRIFARLGLPVLRLKRTRIGPLPLRGLGRGKYRFLTKREVEALLSAASPDSESDEAPKPQRKRPRRRR